VTDVVIVGGGPVGCFLAVLLNDMGVSNVIIERDETPYALPRAIVMDDEIQRAAHDHGLGAWLVANTSPLERGDFLAPDGSVAIGADIPPLGLQGVPPVVVHYQPDLDAMLRARCVDGGSRALWGHTVTDLVDHGDHCITTVDTGETITSRWVVGCDGASSWTRRHVGLTLEDLRFDQEWLVVDIELNEGSTVDLPRGVRQYCRTERPCTYVQGVRRFRRWEFQVQPHEDSDLLNTDDGLWQLLAEWVTPNDARIVRSAVYRFHAVVAPRMQQGNVFLAGDSAHQTPPFAGQGLNSGMRDALNLAWKMSFVKRGFASPKILDTYTSEREPHVRSTVAHAVDMGRLIDQLAGRTSHGVDIESGYGGTRPAPHIVAGVVTGDDPRVGHQFWYHPGVSLAVRQGGASFAVVTAEPISLPHRLASIEAVNVVAPQTLGDAFAIVVRPDRYVAAVAATLDELESISEQLVASFFG
jgi:3-(3-hydroxy-phenyl)propionate hydroxylase